MHARIRRYLRHGMLPQLAVFEASVRLGSFTQAADELHLAQPTVSTQIRKLTEVVGQPLFEQIGRKMHVTPAGTVLYEGCQDILGTLARVDQTLSDLQGVRCGRLRLAAGTGAQELAMQWLGDFSERHPDVDVALEIHNRSALVARLAANQDDLYIFANPPTDREVVRQMILPNRLVPLARADHPLAHQRAIPLVRFAEEPFLMREPGSATGEIAAEWFARHGLAPRIRMALSTNESLIRAISAGLGVSILSDSARALAGDSSRIVALDVAGFPLERTWQFVYPVGKRVPAVARSFMDFVRVQVDATVTASRDGHLRPARTVLRRGTRVPGGSSRLEDVLR